MARARLARLLVRAVTLALVGSATVLAQWGWGRLPEGPGVPARFPDAAFGDGRFAVCKLMFTSVRSEPQGMGWATDYPYAGHNLMIRIGELTKTPVSVDKNGEPHYWVVQATDPALYRCPFLMAADAGTMGLDDDEVEGLRSYLLKGGFFWSDDFWGTEAWQQFAAQMKRVLPEYQIVDVPADHSIRRTLYTIAELPQITNINLWRRYGGDTRERGWDSPHANFRMIADEHKRVMVLMTHNTDIADSWERESEEREFFLQFAPGGYAVGVNVALYAMTH